MDTKTAAPVMDVDATGASVQTPRTTAVIASARTNNRIKKHLDSDIVYQGRTHQLIIWSSRKLGSGSFGTVFEADMVDPAGQTVIVAVKAFHLLDDKHQNLLEREIAGWQTLNHPRILPLYGLCDEFGLAQVGLVSPLASNGNMKEFISKNPTKDKVALLRQVAEGLVYLHEAAKLVHGDLKCSNILIADDESALLADFGLSTFIESTENATSSYIRRLNTASFAAPELITDEAFGNGVQTPSVIGALASTKRSKTTYSDSFAIGSLVYEACSGAEPWKGLIPVVIIQKVINGEIPPRNVENDVLWELSMRCWARDPLRRPNSIEILRTLTEDASPTSR